MTLLESFPVAEGCALIPSEAPAPTEYVYVIQSPLGGAVKIGYSRDPQARLADMQVGSPVPLRLVATFRGGRAEERALHEALRGSRSHGEWFMPSHGMRCLLRERLGRGPSLLLIEKQRRTHMHDDHTWDCIRCRKTADFVGAILGGLCRHCLREIAKLHAEEEEFQEHRLEARWTREQEEKPHTHMPPMQKRRLWEKRPAARIVQSLTGEHGTVAR